MPVMINRRSTVNRSIWLGLLVSLLCTMATSASAQSKPNVVFIVADNVGYEDLGP